MGILGHLVADNPAVPGVDNHVVLGEGTLDQDNLVVAHTEDIQGAVLYPEGFLLVARYFPIENTQLLHPRGLVQRSYQEHFWLVPTNLTA